MGTLEAKLEEKIVQHVKNIGGKAFKWVSPGCTGVPDRICILPGPRIIFIEVKRPGRKNGESPRQKKIIKWLRDIGCEVFVIGELAQMYKILGGKCGV